MAWSKVWGIVTAADGNGERLVARKAGQHFTATAAAKLAKAANKLCLNFNGAASCDGVFYELCDCTAMCVLIE